MLTPGLWTVSDHAPWQAALDAYPAVLALVAPDRYPFFDEMVAAQVDGLGPVAWSTAYYRRYAAALVERATPLGADWDSVMVERALWANGARA